MLTRSLGPMREEILSADFGDDRLTRRLGLLVDSLAGAPEMSFPEAGGGDDSVLEGTYRFLNNPRVTPERILAPHYVATRVRAEAVKTVLVPHDTTEFSFGNVPRGDLGRVGRGNSYGFCGHFALVVEPGSRQPLGTIALQTYARPRRTGPYRRKKADDPTLETRRWSAGVELAEKRLAGVRAIHVMDREADNFAFLAEMKERGRCFVVRMKYDRVLDKSGEARTVRAKIEDAPVRAQREVALSRRRRQDLPAYRERYPPREGRPATLEFSARELTLPRPTTSRHSPHEELTLNLVHVREVEAPQGLEPIDWLLWTTQPIETAEQILAIVDAYRGRWVIEEYFKALKTGCAFEKRQLESSKALLNALAMLTPIAWRLLRLRNLGRHHPDASATQALTPVQIKCLRAAYIHFYRRKLPSLLSVREAMLAVGKLGGHLARNGDPGWIVLGRGYDKLLTIELGHSLFD
jgi:Transposase DNA-binding/Transposase DDE domain